VPAIRQRRPVIGVYAAAAGMEEAVTVAQVRVASFNVENLFRRPRAFTTADWRSVRRSWRPTASSTR
jgi:hypothetical protein